MVHNSDSNFLDVLCRVFVDCQSVTCGALVLYYFTIEGIENRAKVSTRSGHWAVLIAGNPAQCWAAVFVESRQSVLVQSSRRQNKSSLSEALLAEIRDEDRCSRRQQQDGKGTVLHSTVQVFPENRSIIDKGIGHRR